MHRIDHTTAATSLPTPKAAGTPGFFTGGNPSTGTPATVVSEDWLNAQQEEMLAILAAAGITPSKLDNAQVLAALRQLIIGSKQIFTASGSFTVPAGVKLVTVEVVGGGGGGGGTGTADTGGGGGGGGGYAWKRCAVTPGQVVPVTIAGMALGTISGGVNGNTSSFGAFCSATGGSGGQPFASNPSGGPGGVGIGGDLNLSGSFGFDGGSSAAYGGGGGIPGGIGGGAGRGGVNAGIAAPSYGGGGGGGYLTSTGTATGGNGAPGLVIVSW